MGCFSRLSSYEFTPLFLHLVHLAGHPRFLAVHRSISHSRADPGLLRDLFESAALKNITVRNLLLVLTALTLILCLVKDGDGSGRGLTAGVAAAPIATGS